MLVQLSVILVIALSIIAPGFPKLPVAKAPVFRSCDTVDEYGQLPAKQERVRLDSFAKRVKDLSDVSAIVIVSGDTPLDQSRAKALKTLDYLVNRRQVKAEVLDAIVVKQGAHEELRIRLLTCPRFEVKSMGRLEGSLQTEYIKGSAVKKP